jgi:hypothetical protein
MRPVAAIAIVALAPACAATQRPPPAADDATPRAAATRFLEAVEAGRWDDAYALLSARWRERLTPERLAADRRQGGALAKDHLDRARIALRGEPSISGDEARFDKALRLVREADGWRVDGFVAP